MARDGNAKQAILAAALKAFARDGFDGATMPNIAEMAKIAHPLIYYHFKSKDNLWRETVNYACDGLIAEAAAIETASLGFSPLEKLHAVIKAFAQFAAHYPDHLWLIMAEARTDSGRLTWLKENHTNGFLERLQNILRDVQQQNQIREVPLESLTFTIVGGILMYFSLNLRLPKDVDVTELAERHAEVVWDVLMRGLRP